MAPDSRKSDMTGRLSARCSRPRLSCESATTGTGNEYARHCRAPPGVRAAAEEQIRSTRRRKSLDYSVGKTFDGQRQGRIVDQLFNTIRSADRAPGFSSAEAGTRAAPLPRTPFSPYQRSTSASLRTDFYLTKPNTSCTIEMPASLCSDGVRG